MDERPPDCLHEGAAPDALPIHAVRPAGLPALLARLSAPQSAYLHACGFHAEAAQTVLLPGEAGLAGVVLGLGEAAAPHAFGALPGILPAGSVWQLASGVTDVGAALTFWALGAYRFGMLRSRAAPASPRLVVPTGPGIAAALSAIRATWLGRDLVNMPANLLGPADLAETARAVLAGVGAHAAIVSGAALAARYPVIDAVGRGAARGPAVVLGAWRHANAGPEAPLLSLCGKGVCFDTGGYDVKPPSGMLRMKKDMAGAAAALGLARMIVEAELPVRLEIRLGCVENMISGHAMRPLDVLRTRGGVSIEVGNTDAEGRLVLCELLAEAAEAAPSALLDFATLTGAARVALGPDLAALFSNDDALAEAMLDSGRAANDPLWRLPLWQGYQSWVDSKTADVNNVADNPHAGAIVAALFLQRFVPAGIRWGHFDVYGWNDSDRPARPAGGEMHAMRAAFGGLKQFVASWS